MENLPEVLEEVAQERRSQETRWGQQNLPDGTGNYLRYTLHADNQRMIVETRIGNGTLSYSDILLEEVAEAVECTDATQLRAELVQVAAVAVAWIECIDRRKERI